MFFSFFLSSFRARRGRLQPAPPYVHYLFVVCVVFLNNGLCTLCLWSFAVSTCVPLPSEARGWLLFTFKTFKTFLQTGGTLTRSCYLEVKDAGVVVTEALVAGNDSGHHILIQGQRGDGGQQPAVTCTDRKTLSNTDSGPPPTGRLLTE